MSQENVTIVRQTFGLVDGLDMVEFLGSLDEVSFRAMIEETYTPDVEIQWLASNPDVNRVYRGHDGAMLAFTDWLNAWDEFTVELLDLLDAGEHVIAPNIQRGKGKVSGVSTEMRSAFVCTVREGKIARLLELDDEATALDALRLRE